MVEIPEGDRLTDTLDQQSIDHLSRIDILKRQDMVQENDHQRAHELQHIESTLRRIKEKNIDIICAAKIFQKPLITEPTDLRCITCTKLFGQ
ncbi:hypothetical protein [Pseudovibrio sp. Tun.PSC04-5.I4]|uniref:hypothetical protein n=1 Tax=Pseudovibrio sp. Tun.PSC04-5.I4 TaxID=1798213 RepID=UPI001AD94F5D|nr:hypothetical protein [Pseudovibrio sp. Tun.PSC04-5.I4]